jgi:hypothetical protein
VGGEAFNNVVNFCPAQDKRALVGAPKTPGKQTKK